MGFTGSRYDIQTATSPGLPAMLRRRLDAVGRATCGILAELDPEGACPLLHASRHGDAAHTLEMLTSLAQGEPVSPSRFSMSVHNAVLGVHSIARQQHRPMQALGACGHEFDALLHEARGYLMEGHAAVVAVFSEGALPAAYHDHTEFPNVPCAVGLRLTQSRGRRLLADTLHQSARPTPLDISAWLNAEKPHLDSRQRWWLEAE